MNSLKFICLLFIVFSAAVAVNASETTKPIIRLGIMAFTEPERYTTYNKSDDYMLKELSRIIQTNLPEYKIETKVLRTHELVKDAREGKLDLIFESSGCYASLLPDGIYPLATIATNIAPNPNQAVAGAFVVSSSRRDLNTIDDLKGKTAISGLKDMFFNYQLPLSALTDRNIEPENYFSNWEQVDYPVNKVLKAIESRRKDVGLIRACSIEMLSKEEQKKFKVIEPVKNSPPSLSAYFEAVSELDIGCDEVGTLECGYTDFGSPANRQTRNRYGYPLENRQQFFTDRRFI